MVRRTVIALVIAATLAGRSAAIAQTPSPAAPQMPAWDADFSLGMISNSGRDEGDDHEHSSVHAEARVDFGHYWTQHLKTEVGLAFLNRWENYSYETVPIPSGRGGNYVFTNNSLRMVAVTPTFTYQFFENQFAHPYVSAAARVSLFDIHSSRYAQTVTQNGVTSTVPALERASSKVIVRPVVAAGFKSYLSEHAFVRTEGSTMFGPDGSPYLALRLGVGFDF
jgi:hypothetical protein